MKLDTPQIQGEYTISSFSPSYPLYTDMSYYHKLNFLQVILPTPKLSIDSKFLFILTEVRILHPKSKCLFLQFCRCDLNQHDFSLETAS